MVPTSLTDELLLGPYCVGGFGQKVAAQLSGMFSGPCPDTPDCPSGCLCDTEYGPDGGEAAHFCLNVPAGWVATGICQSPFFQVCGPRCDRCQASDTGVACWERLFVEGCPPDGGCPSGQFCETDKFKPVASTQCCNACQVSYCTPIPSGCSPGQICQCQAFGAAPPDAGMSSVVDGICYRCEESLDAGLSAVTCFKNK
jgi:hypothetical protein